MTTPLEQIKEKLEKMKIPKDGFKKGLISSDQFGYNQAISDIQAVLPGIIQEVVEGTLDKVIKITKTVDLKITAQGINKDVIEFYQNSIDETRRVLLDAFASLKETNK